MWEIQHNGMNGMNFMFNFNTIILVTITHHSCYPQFKVSIISVDLVTTEGIQSSLASTVLKIELIHLRSENLYQWQIILKIVNING